MASSVLRHREPTHLGSLAVNAPSLNTGRAEEVGGGHRHLHAGLVEGLAEPLQDGLASGGDEPYGTRSSSWKFTPYAPSSARRWTDSTGSSGGAHLVAERVAAGVADGPEPEGEPGQPGSVRSMRRVSCRTVSSSGSTSRTGTAGRIVRTWPSFLVLERVTTERDRH